MLHPGGELSFVELVVLMDVEIAYFLLLGPAGRDRTQRRIVEFAGISGYIVAMSPAVKTILEQVASWPAETRRSFPNSPVKSRRAAPASIA